MIAVQEVKVGSRTRQVQVRPFAWNLRAPTHMEWTLDGRLLVVERTAGKVKDATQGGDMAEVKPFAWSLAGPASICPLPDGRVLLSEFWRGRVVDISPGGNAERMPIFADGLIRPYSLVCLLGRDGAPPRIFVGTSDQASAPGDLTGSVTEITSGRATKFISDIPDGGRSPGAEGFAPPESWPDEWILYAKKCKKTWVTNIKGPGKYQQLVIASSSMGRILVYPVENGPGDGLSLAARHTVAYDTREMGGIIAHPENGLLYVTEPMAGSVLAVDPRDCRAYTFDPPVVRGLPDPTCVRFSPEGERMLVCSPTNGVIWEVRGFAG
jgi:hypothetical protein